ncbi:MAG: DUF3892 domain-containing protein [Pseudomonadales bacterium]
MNQFEVNCITMSVSGRQYEHITHIGNSANQWRLARAEAVLRIEQKTEAFYTVDAGTGRRAYIGVVRIAGREPYLRTYADGKWNDNLLAQRECGEDCRIL